MTSDVNRLSARMMAALAAVSLALTSIGTVITVPNAQTPGAPGIAAMTELARSPAQTGDETHDYA